MGTLASQSGMSSATPSISDLDGYSFRDFSFPPTANYPVAQDDDFGFDPPQPKPGYVNSYQTYSPPADPMASGWPEFQRDEDVESPTDKKINLDAFEMDDFLSSTLPNTDTAIARFGQMTPPRSNSAASTASKQEETMYSPKSAPTDRPKRGSKNSIKEELSAPTTTTGTGPSKPGRKRKSTRRPSTTTDDGAHPEDNKRKQSLEKNRLAAAKCRVNKKEKTEKLQRDSHDKAVENALLKNTVMQLKDVVQQLNAMVIAHANGNCDGCNSPEEIRAHLNHLGHEFFNHHLSLNGHGLQDFSQLNYSGLANLGDSYFANGPEPGLNPPLPEFDRTADFEVHTPMQVD